MAIVMSGRKIQYGMDMLTDQSDDSVDIQSIGTDVSESRQGKVRAAESSVFDTFLS